MEKTEEQKQAELKAYVADIEAVNKKHGMQISAQLSVDYIPSKPVLDPVV